MPVHAPGSKHQPIAHQHPGHTYRKHGVHIGMSQPSNHATGNQSDVFRYRHAKTASHQHQKHRRIAVLGKKGF